jgi:glyoxylase I family protein
VPARRDARPRPDGVRYGRAKEGNVKEGNVLRGIDHIELIVRDVDETVAFFRALGFELLTRTPHHGGSAELKLPGEGQPVFEIHRVQGEENPGVNHIAFRCDDVRATHGALAEGGLAFEHGPRLVRASGRVVANFRDPDGWRLQLVDATRVAPEEEDGQLVVDHNESAG